MKLITAAFLIVLASFASFGQNAQQIFDTERAFEKMVAEKGIRDGFIEYMSPTGVIFRPDPVNARESFKSRPASSAALYWNPIKIEVSSNGALAYSIGNSILKPKGKNDTTEVYGHYLSVWARQPNGDYLAALDTGVNHPKPATTEPTWTSGSATVSEKNPNRLFAGDSSIGFYRMAENRGLVEAYKAFAAEDIYLYRQEQAPFSGRKAAIDRLKDDNKLTITFAKRRSFIEAGDLAYVYSVYSMKDDKGVEKEKGNFVQVWKFRNGKWLIAADVFIPVAPEKS